MSTGPAELAEILSSPEKRDRWIVFTLLEIKTDLAQHIVEDKAQFGELKERYGAVSSSVGNVKTDRDRLVWSWKTIAGVMVGIAFLIDVAAHAKELLK